RPARIVTTPGEEVFPRRPVRQPHERALEWHVRRADRQLRLEECLLIQIAVGVLGLRGPGRGGNDEGEQERGEDTAGEATRLGRSHGTPWGPGVDPEATTLIRHGPDRAGPGARLRKTCRKL